MLRTNTHELGQTRVVREIWQPSTTVAHRTVTSADGTTAPAGNNAAWLSNTVGARWLRIYANVTFSGGSSPTAVLQPYVKFGSTDDDVGELGATSSTTYAAGRIAFDVEVKGDDALIFVESVTGSPSSFSVAMRYAWR